MTSTNNGSHEQQAAGSPEPEPFIGTVAEEAARLVEVLSSRHSSPRSDSDAAGAGAGAATGSGTGTAAGSGSGAGPQDGPAPERPSGEQHCTCGGRRPAACAVCPVCQLIAFVQRVNPETIDRLADAVELAATGLRDLATVQRARRGGHDEPEPS